MIFAESTIATNGAYAMAINWIPVADATAYWPCRRHAALTFGSSDDDDMNDEQGGAAQIGLGVKLAALAVLAKGRGEGSRH